MTPFTRIASVLILGFALLPGPGVQAFAADTPAAGQSTAPSDTDQGAPKERHHWCKDNPEQCKAKREQWCKDNPEKCKARKERHEQWCKNHPDRCKGHEGSSDSAPKSDSSPKSDTNQDKAPTE